MLIYGIHVLGRKCSVRAILPMSALYEFLSELTHAPNVVYVVATVL